MSLVLQLVVYGIATGAIYALIALGYTMVYGIIELINFAHGDLFMLGSFFALQLVIWLGVNTPTPPTAGRLAAAPLFCPALAVFMDRVVYKPVRSAPKVAGVVSAVGVSFIFMN